MTQNNQVTNSHILPCNIEHDEEDDSSPDCYLSEENYLDNKWRWETKNSNVKQEMRQTPPHIPVMKFGILTQIYCA